MRNKMNRILGFALSVLLVAGMLPVSALATEKTYVAAVGDKQYETLTEAIEAAKTAEDPAVKILADLDGVTGENGQSLDLGEVYLVVEGTDQITIEDSDFIGKHQEQILLNKGNLILKNVTIENTEGTYAVFSEPAEEETAVSLMISGGRFVGKTYGIGLKEMQMQLNAYSVQQENAETHALQDILEVPVISGQIAAFQLEDSAIELLCDLGEDTSYTVDRTTPGLFAFAPEYEDSEMQESWFKSIHAENTFHAAEKKWELSGSIAEAVELDQTNFTYNGTAQAPEVSAELYDKSLTEDHYTVSYTMENGDPVEETVNVGKYTVVIEGKDPYSEAYKADFEIVAAVPTVTWDKESEQLEYTGNAAALTAKASVQLIDGESYNGEINYAYRAGSTGEFKNGLPVEQGTYEVKAYVDETDNYAAAETATLLKVTIGQKTNATLTVEVSTPESGHIYNGSEIRPMVTVKAGETVIPAEQYEVSYANNINVGTATVTVKAKAGGSYAFEDLTATFEIKPATAATLTISGQPAAVTYGDKAFQLSTAGGISGEAVTWSVIEGADIATVETDGTVTISGVGKVKIRAAQSGGANYTDRSAEWEIEVAPAGLSVASVEVENKVYDGNKAVKIKSVELQGILNNDTVSVSVSGLQGELENAKAGIYEKVTVPALTLNGEDAANYTLIQPTAAVQTNAVISKAEVPAALGERKTTVAVNTVDLVVENLCEGMPADAGTITYSKKNQGTSDGATLIVYDWKVDENGKLTSRLEPGKAGEQVLYYVNISSENYKDTELKVVVTFGSQEVDASKVTVTPQAGTFTYNGKEQKPAVEVKYDNTVLNSGTDYDVTYPADTVNAGEKELTVKFKGNYSGSATAKYTVSKAKVSVSGLKAENKTYDGTTTATVTATLSGAISGDDVKVTATGIFSDKNSGSSKTINVTYKLSGEDAANYELSSTTGTTTAKITPVSASSLNSQISGLSLNNADSGNKYALQTVVNRANAALADTGLSSSEKTAISNVKWSAEDMIGRIESASAAAATESIRKSADITKENVTLNDKALLEKAQSDLNSALTSYSGNYTTAEETEIGNKKTRIADALTVITRVQSAQTMIGALPAQFTEETMIDPALKTSVEDAKTAFDALSDYEKSLLGEDAALKLTSAVEAAGNQTEEPEKSETNTLTSAAPEEGEGFKFPTWILVVAVIAAGLCGGGLFIYKRKQEENEYNW